MVQNALQALQIQQPESRTCQIALDGLVDEALLAQAARENGYAQSAADLQQRVASIAPLLGDHLTPTELARRVRQWDAAAWQRERIIAQAPTQASQVHARQVLFTSQAEADQALEQLRQGGAAFDDLAAQASPGTGGDLGWFARGTLTQPEIEAAAFALKPGEFSPVIHTPLGYHIVQVTAAQPERPLTPSAYRRIQRKALAGWLGERRAQSRVETLVACPGGEAPAPETPESGGLPDYTAQPGDSFALIAREFKVSVSELTQANPDVNPERLEVGQRLAIPGREGLSSELTVEKMPPGETAESLARRLGVPWEDWVRLNRIVNPEELYAGSLVVLPASIPLGGPAAELPSLETGQAAMEYAALYRQNPWVVAWANQVASPALLLPGEPLRVPPGQADSAPAQAPLFTRVTLDPKTVEQGNTAVIRVETAGPAAPGGWLDGRTLHFFPTGEHEYVAIQGVHAMAEPGLTDLSLSAVTGDGQQFVYEQAMRLYRRAFVQDPPLQVDPATLDPAFTGPEDAQIAGLTAPASPQKLWDGQFVRPVDRSCRPSGYGDRRSYNGSGYTFFHAGLDYGLCDVDTIFAPAAGVVVFTGSLTVRGNATIIDHGWGVYSGFWHQSEIDVKIGDRVSAGQAIGKIGATGRVTGAHLHWEVWAGGVQVDPVIWLLQIFP
jgi:murein DD-endopeptidase MepM/ murein hydrolase activator NlpD